MSAPSVASPTPLPPMSSPSSMHQMHPQHPTITVQSPPAVGSITAASPSPATSIPSANITSQPTSTSTSTSSSSSSSHSHSSHSSTSTSTSTSTSPPHGHSHSEQKSPPEIFPSVRVADFHEHVKRQQTLIDGAFDQFDIEMEVLQQMSLQPHFVRKIHTPSQHNLKKNRYVNVLPHDPSRVHLSIIDGDPHSDYINASHVKPSLPGANTHYIAAQAPIPLTFVDWWRMIWEQKCNIVLMLTREKERDRQDKEQSKAHRYWPEDGKSQEFGNITVTMTEKKEEGDTIIRIFQLQRGGETRQVVHLQYIGWPDHGVPEEYSSFTKLFQIYRSYRDQGVTGPVLTHCSAGIGRTGTFCALDMILDNISKKRDGSGNSTINVFNIVRALRDSRPGMVQSKAQYAFCSFFLDHCIQNHLFDAS